MYSATAPTGDPRIPPHIHHAKQIFREIQAHSDASNLDKDLPDIGIEIDDLENVVDAGEDQVNYVQVQSEEDESQAARPRRLFEAAPNARPLVRTPVSARRHHGSNGNGLTDLTAFVMATFAASARTEAVDREERRQAKIDRHKVGAEEREERRWAENERRQEAEDREERRQDRQMNMTFMIVMISLMNLRAAAAMQPLQNAMMQQHRGNAGNQERGNMENSEDTWESIPNNQLNDEQND
jgi:hypothetical protein